MKWHVLRPAGVAVVLIALILIARIFVVPDDFGVHGQNFTYGYYRLGNVQEWKDFPVKYRGREYCVDCHKANVRTLNWSSHKSVECENCHGPAIDHPAIPQRMTIDRSREQCLRCHAQLNYPRGARDQVPLISNRMHRRRKECSTCHDPHSPGEMKE